MSDRFEPSDDDAKLRALFGEAPRAAGDPAFTAQVMKRVDAVRHDHNARKAGFVSGVLAAGGAFTYLHWGSIVGAFADAFAGYAGYVAQAPQITAGGLTMMIAGAAIALGFYVAQR